MELKKDNKQKKRKKSLHPYRIAAFGLFLALYLISGWRLLSIILENRRAADSYSELRQAAQESVQTKPQAVPTVSPKASSSGASQISPAETAIPVQSSEQEKDAAGMIDFSALQAINPQIAAWIRADGTVIDYPVLHGDDNDYYLTHLYSGKTNAAGSIFMDYRNEGTFYDRNTVIYGHHMKNGTMFTALEGYKSQEYYDEHPTMRLYTPDGEYTVELICGTIEDGNQEFMRFEFGNEADFAAYVEGFRARSTFESPVTLRPGDRIVSLCTCTYEQINARYTVIGRIRAQ